MKSIVNRIAKAFFVTIILLASNSQASAQKAPAPRKSCCTLLAEYASVVRSKVDGLIADFLTPDHNLDETIYGSLTVRRAVIPVEYQKQTQQATTVKEAQRIIAELEKAKQK